MKLKRPLFISSLVCGAVLAGGILSARADQVQSGSEPAASQVAPAVSSNEGNTTGSMGNPWGSSSQNPTGSVTNDPWSNPNQGTDGNPTNDPWNTPSQGNPAGSSTNDPWNNSNPNQGNGGSQTTPGSSQTMPNGQPYDPTVDGAPFKPTSQDSMDQNKPLTSSTASNGQSNTWKGDPAEPCTQPKQLGPNSYEVGVMDPTAFNAMSWLKYFLAQKDPQATVEKVGMVRTAYGYIKTFTIKKGNGQTVNFTLKIDAVANAPHLPIKAVAPQDATVSGQTVKADEQRADAKKHPAVQASQMHPVAVLDVSVAGTFNFATATAIIQTTANNQAIHVNLAAPFPVDKQQGIYYFYVQVPGGKQYLIGFRVKENNQLPQGQFTCQLESGQLPWPTQGIQPANPAGDDPYGNPSDDPYGNDNPYGNQGNPSDDPYGNNDPYGNQGNPSDDPYGNNDPYGNQGNPSDDPYGNDNPYGNQGNPSNDPYGDEIPAGSVSGTQNNPFGNQVPAGSETPEGSWD